MVSKGEYLAATGGYDPGLSGLCYLSQEVGRKVLVNAQSSSLLCNARESDGGGDLKLLSDI